MKELFEEIVGVIGVVGCFIVALVVLSLLSWGGYLAYLKYVAPTANTLQYQAVKHSQGYVEGHNAQAEEAINEYNDAVQAGDTAHANADKNTACLAASQLNAEEMNPQVAAFYSQHCQ